MAELSISHIADNGDGWGPNGVWSFSTSWCYEAPFYKDQKLGRAIDWTKDASNQEGEPYTSSSRPKAPRFPSYRHRYGKKPLQLPQRKDEDLKSDKNEKHKLYCKQPLSYLKSSVHIKPSWTMLEQIPFTSLSKLTCNVSVAEDLVISGALNYYDKSYDRIIPKSSKKLERFKPGKLFRISTTDDPIIQKLASEDQGSFFATDTILSTLMCAPRSVCSWDILVTKVGNKLFFDSRNGDQLDMPSVNETCQEPLPEAKENPNSSYSLAMEAAYINQNFSQQVLVRDDDKVELEEPQYRYRKWKLDDATCFVARCEVHGVVEVKGNPVSLTLNALNEFDPKITGIDWRQKLDTQPGAVLANELKNNANKLAKWTAQALLASADMMKLGYVSRTHPRDPCNHAILGVQSYKPKELAAQINLSTCNMWGIVKSIVDICMKLADGKFIIVKDPSKPQIQLYRVPFDAFENDYAEEPLLENVARD